MSLARDDSSRSNLPIRGRPPQAHRLVQGSGWHIDEHVCYSGPGDRPFEELYGFFTIAAVLEGVFTCKSQDGKSLLHPGALLLGNHGACFECGHDHSTGDRCIALHIEPEAFAEVAASVAGSGRFRFPAGMVESAPALVPWLIRIEAGRIADCRLQADEFVTDLTERVIGATSQAGATAARISASDERRISTAIRFIEMHVSEDIELDRLAVIADMSKYHFLRTFRRTVGVTPYQFVLAMRLRRAAVRLISSAEPVAAIAFDVGFGDLSTFNARFKRQFGVSPASFRSRERSR